MHIIYKDVDGNREDAFFKIDGEHIVLKEGVSDEVIDAFKLASTNAVCGAPGFTHCLQECDKADVFRDFKTGLDTVTKRNTDVRDSTLETELIRIINVEFRADFPTIEIAPNLKLKILFALQKCVYVIRDKYVTPRKIKEGFIRVGTHRTVDKDDNLIGEGDCTVDYSRYLFVAIYEFIFIFDDM